MKCSPTVGIPEYCLEIVEDSKIAAKQIAAQVRQGIEDAADFCAMQPPVCADNLGIPRADMPQIEKTSPRELERDGEAAKARAVLASGGAKTVAPLKALTRYLRSQGVKVREGRRRVGELKATQREILASKAWGMADGHLRGKFPAIGKQILISSDDHILDGHHRWAALLLIDPHRTMDVLQIDMPIRELLRVSNDFPGVYLADFRGKPLKKQRRKTEQPAVLRRPKRRKATRPRARRSAGDIRRAIDDLAR
jgi:hypothetical protein